MSAKVKKTVRWADESPVSLPLTANSVGNARPRSQEDSTPIPPCRTMSRQVKQQRRRSISDDFNAVKSNHHSRSSLITLPSPPMHTLNRQIKHDRRKSMSNDPTFKSDRRGSVSDNLEAYMCEVFKALSKTADGSICIPERSSSLYSGKA
ncbi:hypothetical protein BC830DRAFT_255572 [Chytriomyces sp. MP71]|nr:hypothetical protein BC830DRAFT_255572 [Chytriomyces sp. MP71]